MRLGISQLGIRGISYLQASLEAKSAELRVNWTEQGQLELVGMDQLRTIIIGWLRRYSTVKAFFTVFLPGVAGKVSPQPPLSASTPPTTESKDNGQPTETA